MSGFLSNLVTKSLNLTAVVRPRLLSLFEPASELAPHLPITPTSREHDGAHTPDQPEHVGKETVSAPSHATLMPERISQQTRAQDTDAATDANVPVSAQDLRASMASQPAAPMAAPMLRALRPQAVPPESTPSFAPVQDLRASVVSQQAAPPEPTPSFAPVQDLRAPVVSQQAALPEPTPSPVPALIEQHTIERVVVERVATLPTQLAAAQHHPQTLQLRNAMQPGHELVDTGSRVTQPETDNNATKLITQEQTSIILSTPATPRPGARTIERLHIAAWASPVPIQAQEPHAPTSSGIVAQPQVTRYVEPLRRPTVTDAPLPGPTVQVTIGRIEVRATQQPSQTTRPPQEPIRLSLDEYLRQRSRGGGG